MHADLSNFPWNNPDVKDVEQVNFTVNLREKNESPTSNVHSPDICFE